MRALLHQLPDALCNSRAHNGDAAGVRRASDHALCTGLPMTMSVEVATDCPTRDRLLSEFSIPTEGRFDSPLLHLALPRSLTAVIALKENVMSRQHYARCKQVVVAATLALGAISSALADDSSMNPFAGDSYAYFNGGHNVGNLNYLPLSSRNQDRDATSRRPTTDQRQVEQRIMLANGRARTTPGISLRDDTGA